MASSGSSIGAWITALRGEYLAARGSGDATALRKVVSRYLTAFSSAGSAESRKSKEFFELQVDEARVAM